MKRALSLLPLFVVLSACNVVNLGPPLAGDWYRTAPNGSEVHLLLRPDNTFHVDIQGRPGIEAEGVYELGPDREITFINEIGTDAVASDPTPGTYQYYRSGNGIGFRLIADDLTRRAGILNGIWSRDPHGGSRQS